MIIKKVTARQVLDSRKEPTIQIIIKTGFFRKFKTSAPEGESKGKYEAKSYAKDLERDIEFINSINLQEINNIVNKYGKNLGPVEAFSILEIIENLVTNQIGANSLFALEASLLKMLAYENKKELYDFLGTDKKLPHPIGNAIGGGLHSRGINGKIPDFQEFLFIGNSKTIKESVDLNDLAYQIAGKLLNAKKRNDEGAWETDKTNEEILDIMDQIQEGFKKQGKKIVMGLDVAASSFYKNMNYNYKNPPQQLSKSQQILYIKRLINRYKLYYIEDPLEENDFSGFRSLIGRGCFIVGDDLTTTNPE